MKGDIIITYNNFFNPDSKLGIWSWGNISNYWLSENRKSYPSLDIKRRKVSDIIDNDRPEEIFIKNEILSNLNKI